MVEEKTEEEKKEEESVTIRITDMLSSLRKGKNLHDGFAKKFRENYLIAGKQMKLWKDYFKVELPPDLNPALIQEIGSKLMGLHQEASFLKAEAEARLSACQSTSDDRYREKYAALVAEYKSEDKKLPAKDTLIALTEHSISDIKNAITHAEIELAFWKEVLADISNSRKTVELATICMSVEAKAVQHERYIDKLNSRQ
jgi:hypothetical protein